MLTKKEDLINIHNVPTINGNYTIEANHKTSGLLLRFELIPLYEIATFHLNISAERNEHLNIADCDPVEYLPITHKETRELWDFLVDAAEVNREVTRHEALQRIEELLS